MKRDRVLEETRRGLAKTGFFLSRPHGERGLCFDFVARRDDTLVIVKVLQNVDALNKETAHELLEVARILEASPLVVGERSDCPRSKASSARCSSGSNASAIESSERCGAPSTRSPSTRRRRSSRESGRPTGPSSGRPRSCRT